MLKLETNMRAVVIGSGIGGLSAAIRLCSLGFDVTVLERAATPGGRAMVRKQDGFTFDMGPTVLTVPHFIEELFRLERGVPELDVPDFPPELLTPDARVTEGTSGGPATSRYVDIVPILPFYRIFFADGTWFDYDGDPERTVAQIRNIEPADVAGYERFHADAKAIFERGFLELGYTHFGDIASMLRVVPDLLRLDAVRSLFSFTSRYFRSDKLRQVFSFETLLVGGNPLRVPAIYAMIHFVEKTWGIHFARGGTGALVAGMVRKLEELGGRLICDADVEQIEVDDGAGGPAGRIGRRVATGVRLADGRRLPAQVVVSNADWAMTNLRLLAPQHRPWTPDLLVKAQHYSMSLLVIYFGFKAPAEPLQLQHHNILLGPRYEGLLTDIFDRKVLAEDFSQYLHLPTLTDPSLAPPGHHAAYTLIPVPHKGAGIDWSVVGPRLTEAVLTDLEERGFIPGLRENLVTMSTITPDWFEGPLSSWLGNAFGVEPRLTQSAWFRPHNRSRDVEGLYLVGASAQPGAGTPSVMMSAKMTARLVAEDVAAGVFADRAASAASGGAPTDLHAAAKLSRAAT
jgi:phytoene desaturase